MNKEIKLLLLMASIIMIFCLCGCEKICDLKDEEKTSKAILIETTDASEIQKTTVVGIEKTEATTEMPAVTEKQIITTAKAANSKPPVNSSFSSENSNKAKPSEKSSPEKRCTDNDNHSMKTGSIGK